MAAKTAARGSSQNTPRQPGTPVPEYVEQEWQRTVRPDIDADLEWAAAENDDEEEWECVACGKTFRSEAAWDSHERSKKHMQAVDRLKRAMQEEDEEFGLAEEEPAASGSEEEGMEKPPDSPLEDTFATPPEEAEAAPEA